MEVYGRRKARTDSVSNTSDVENERYCDPCKLDGRHVAAEGYCVDCMEYLCTACYSVHLRPSVWRHHQLLGAETMPKAKPTMQINVTDVCTEVCKIHSDKIIEYFCNSHETLGCSACITTVHRSCGKVDYIPKVAAMFGTSKELKTLQGTLANLSSLNENSKSGIRNKSKLADKQADRANIHVTSLRKEVNALFDQLEEKIDKSIDDARNRAKKKMVKLENESDTMSSDLMDHISTIETRLNEGKLCQLFIEAKRVKQSVKKLHAALNSVAEDIGRLQLFHFQPDQTIVDLTKNLTAMGTLAVQDRNAKIAVFEGDINVKVKSETKKCNITGIIVLPKNQIIVADYMNGCVKLLNVISKDVISVYKTEVAEHSDPFDVTKVENAQIAVTYPSTWKIRSIYVSEDGYLKFVREIDATGACYGIDCSGDTLVVSFNTPPMVKILTMTGEVITKIKGDFRFPDYVAINPYRKEIYISDSSSNTVICVTVEGKAVGEGKHLGGPYGVIVDKNGLVFVCCRSTNSVLQLSKDSKKPYEILHHRDGVKSPQCIAINDQNMLFIGLAGGRIQMFQLY